jgi:polysaccharide biosynthesis protein VpsQ
MDSRSHLFRRKAIRIFALSFGLFIIAAAVIANLGHGESYWPFIYHVRHADKAGHIVLCATLAFLCNLAFSGRCLGRRPFIATTTTLVLLAIISLEELSQIFISARSFDLIDWLADLIGLAIGQSMALFISKTPTSRPAP